MHLQHILLALLTLGTSSIAVEYTVSLLAPTALGGKTLWVDVTEKTGTVAYATAGQSHQVLLTATGTTNGTFTVPAAPGVPARSGTWSAGLPGGLPQGPGNYLFINFVGLVGDATVDNFTFYPAFGAANQIPCNYYLYRGTGLPSEALNNQRGYVRVTDGEAPTPFAPTITFAVGGSTYFTGANAKLRVDVIGSFPLSYQWSKGGPAILNATNATLDLPAIQLTDAGTYTVLVSNSAGSATTNLSIAVNASTPPAITTQPVGVSVVVNQTVNLSVVATGTDPLAYQWRKNGVAVVTNASIFGATGSTLSLYNTTVTATGDYTVVVTNYAGAITSAVATVTISTPSAPVFTLQPPAFTPLLTNATFTITAAVVGVPTPLLQWQKSNVNIVGATNASYTRRDTNYNGGGSYSLIAGNASGSVTSTVAIVSVYDNRLYYNNPAPTNAVLATGGTLLQRAAAYGLPPINFTLQRNGTNVPGFISLPQNVFPEPYSGYCDLAVPNLQPLDSGAYTIVVSNTVGGASTSFVFNVSIQATSAPVVLQPPTNVSAFLSSSGTIVTNAVRWSSFYPVTVQWYSNSLPIIGQASSNLTLGFTSTQQFSLHVVLSNQVGLTTSGVAQVSLTLAPGALDTNFVSTGVFNNQVNALVALTNGGVLAGGAFTTIGASSRNYLVEMSTNGTITPWLAHTNGFNGIVYALHRYADGRVLVGGGFTNLGSSLRYSGIVRLNADGTLDPTFLGGTTNATRYVGDTVFSLAVREGDGAIAIGGGFTNVAGQTQRGVALLDNNGVFQSAFRPVLTNTDIFSFGISALAFQPDGKLLIGGVFSAVNGTARVNIARLNPDGTTDTNFLATLAVNNGAVLALLVQPDGRICLAGPFSTVNGQSRNSFARVQANGTLDSAISGVVGGVFLARQSSGNLIIGGNASLARILTNDTVDPFFAGRGFGTPFGSPGVRSAVFAPDGSLWIGGSFAAVGLKNPQYNIARLMMDTAAPLASPSLGQILFSAGNFRFHLPTAAQRNYRVEMKSNLTDPSWQTHQNFTGDGAEREVMVALPPQHPPRLLPHRRRLKVRWTLVWGWHTLVRPPAPPYRPASSSSASSTPPSTPSSRASATRTRSSSWTVASRCGRASRRWTSKLVDNVPTVLQVLAAVRQNFAIGQAFMAEEFVKENARKTKKVPPGTSSLVQQPDGKILIGGPFYNVNGVQQQNLARLNGDGGPVVSQSTNAGNITLSVATSGTGLTYQWQANGTNLIGATGATFTVTNFAAANAGRYSVIVSNSAAVGVIVSQPAILRSFGDLRMFAGMSIAGGAGDSYRIEAADIVPGVTNWVPVTTFTHPGGTFLYTDSNSPGRPQRYYRAVLLP